MRNIYVYQCTQMLMIKTYPGGDGAIGFVKNSLFENFWAYDTTYGLDIDQYWQSKTTPNTGAVAISGLTFNNWTGTVDNGVQRAPIVIRGSDIVPLTDIALSAFDMWTVNQSKLLHQCKNVYGTGYCAGTSTAGQVLTSFTTTMTVTAKPAAFTSPISPAWGVSGYGLTIPIPVYTPAVMWDASSTKVAAVVKAAVNTANTSPTSSIKASSATSTANAVSTPITSISGSSVTGPSPSITTVETTLYTTLIPVKTVLV